MHCSRRDCSSGPYRTATYNFARRPETSPRLNSRLLSHIVAPAIGPGTSLLIRTSECNRIGYSRPCVVTPHAIEGCGPGLGLVFGLIVLFGARYAIDAGLNPLRDVVLLLVSGVIGATLVAVIAEVAVLRSNLWSPII